MTFPCDLDGTHRDAAALETEALVHAHRPGLVQVKLDGSAPSSASLSALSRARTRCASLGIPLTVVGPGAAQPNVSTESAAA